MQVRVTQVRATQVRAMQIRATQVRATVYGDFHSGADAANRRDSGINLRAKQHFCAIPV